MMGKYGKCVGLKNVRNVKSFNYTRYVMAVKFQKTKCLFKNMAEGKHIFLDNISFMFVSSSYQFYQLTSALALLNNILDHFLIWKYF